MTSKQPGPEESPPRSEISFVTNVCGLLVFVAAVVLQLAHYPEVHAFSAYLATVSGLALGDVPVLCLIAIMASISTVAAIDLIVYRRHVSERVVSRPGVNIARVVTKLMAFYVVILLAWLAYSSFPEYGEFYDRFFGIVALILPFILVLAVPYFVAADLKMAEPEDGYYHFGRYLLGLVLGRRRFPYAAPYIYDLGMGWVVKLFFLPLMFSYLTFEVERLAGSDLSAIFDSPGNLYDFFYASLYGIDLIFATCGYVMTLKLTNSHIKSTDPTLLGWIVCLACYQPFASIVFDQYLHYDNGVFWGQWLSAYPVAYMMWAAAIIILIFLYTLASVSLGFRFSNLTYRGLASSGVYRLTKHPAYISKNLSWWMISIPFIPEADVVQAVKLCLLMVGVNVIYFLRARTEENHLSNYPEYVAYANWMNEHGMFVWLGRIFPYFKYSETRARRANSVVWWRRTSSAVPDGSIR
jgi:hypothetical protein